MSQRNMTIAALVIVAAALLWFWSPWQAAGPATKPTATQTTPKS